MDVKNYLISEYINVLIFFATQEKARETITSMQGKDSQWSRPVASRGGSHCEGEQISRPSALKGTMRKLRPSPWTILIIWRKTEMF